METNTSTTKKKKRFYTFFSWFLRKGGNREFNQDFMRIMAHAHNPFSMDTRGSIFQVYFVYIFRNIAFIL